MREKFNKMMNISLITSLLYAFIGFSFLIFTNLSLEIFSYILAIIFIFNGIGNIVDDYSNFKPFYFFDGFSSGLLSIILGIIILCNPNYITMLIPIVLGLWIIISSTFKLRMALALKSTKNSNWIMTYILSILSIFCGLCLIFNPQLGSLTITKGLGILFIIFSIIDIIDIIIFKKNIKFITRVFE